MNSDGLKNGLVCGLARHLRSDTARQGLGSPCACIRIFVSLLVMALRYAR
jgi:hypothetical protein